MAMVMSVTSTSHSSNYHVFLSFRGEDTRLGFTGNLYKALTDKGIHTFIDDEKLQRGEEITPSLVKAIQESRIAIIVLSKDYASSSFCLDELATIIDCKSKKGLMVIPVFYMVDPSDVRHQRGSYGQALAKHHKRLKHNIDKLQKWKEALRQVAELSGYHFKQGDEYEYKFIGSIVAWVSENINHPARLHVGDYLVGLESRLVQVMKLLDIGCDDGVHMIGIHGMGGIGKSTLARAVYNYLIPEKFDGWCYLEDVREKSNKNGLEHLQNVLLQEILKDKNINITSVARGASMIAERLRRKKVLLLIDDVDNIDQLKAIVGRPNWFGPGSRVIITTRDKHLLKSHKVQKTYEVQELDEQDALKLLKWKAFNKEEVDSTFLEVLNRVLKYASGLPLALEVIGSNLSNGSVEDWKSAIDYYERNSNSNGIHDILKVSFDALKNEVKSVFLDIACCLKGYKLTEVECILGALYDQEMKYPIELLVQKSLIKVDWNGRVEMHDLIQNMGRQIDLMESTKEPPGKRRRLWSPEHIIEVLKDNTGTREIEIICLELPKSSKEQTIKWDGNGFKEMKNLKILIIKNATFSEGPRCLPNSLRVLEWWGYPSNRLPSDFHTENLVICKLPNGCLTSFELHHPSKMFQNLTVLNFDGCKNLTQIPDVSGFSNLEELSFKYCDNLITVDESIGHLGKVKKISAYGCKNLVIFPPIHLTSLENLSLSLCKKLESFPEISGKMENIRYLSLSCTPIKKLAISFVNLVGLEEFWMIDCGSVELPSTILMMPQLTSFGVTSSEVMKWVKQEEDEETMGSMVSSKVSSLTLKNSNLDDDFFLIGITRFAHVRSLNLSGNNFTFLPECIKEFQSLRYLDVSDCMHLQEIRGVPPNMEVFNARNCKSLTCVSGRMLIKEESHAAQIFRYSWAGAWVPEWLEQQSRGASTCFWFRNKFPHKILCLLIAPVLCVYCPFPPKLFINGKAQKPIFHQEPKRIEMDHTYLFDLRWYYYGLDEVSLENGWNHVEVTYEGVIGIDTSDIQAMGIHVFKSECSVEDIRYSDPNRKRKREDDINSIESDNQRLVKKSKLVEKEDSW